MMEAPPGSSSANAYLRLRGAALIGRTTVDKTIKVSERTLEIERLGTNVESILEKVFPIASGSGRRDVCKINAEIKRRIAACKNRRPCGDSVFPGTNCGV